VAKARIGLNQHHASGFDALLDERRGHRAGAGAELDDRPRHARIDIARHGARRRLARWHDGAGRERLFHPRANEAHLIVDTQVLFRDTQRGLEHRG
jgi:hypothetical protein